MLFRLFIIGFLLSLVASCATSDNTLDSSKVGSGSGGSVNGFTSDVR